MTPDPVPHLRPEQVFAVTEATWPHASASRVGPWTVRFGQGGGKRVCATTVEDSFGEADISLAEEAMLGLGQDRLFMIRGAAPAPGAHQGTASETALDTALDTALAARGYRVIDPVVAYTVPTAALTQEPLPRLAAFDIWPPLATQREIWAEGGIGPARIAVMDRVTGPKTTIFGRVDDQAAGAAFVAVDKKVAMIHAIEVAAALRRRSVGRNMLIQAAFWAQDQGAEQLSLLVTTANAGARRLYASLGMDIVAQYHYRIV